MLRNAIISYHGQWAQYEMSLHMCSAKTTKW